MFDKFTGGPGRTLNNIGKTVINLMNGKPLKKSEIPIARRFFGDGYEEKFEQRAGIKSEVEEFTAIDNTERAREGRIASQIFRQLKEAKENGESTNDIFLNAMEKGQINQSVLRRLERRIKDDAKGLSTSDRRVKQLSISRRGQYLLRQIEGKSVKEIREYFKEMTEKGILTKSVSEDINFLKGLAKIKKRLEQ